jgi:hypothetical protein
VNAGRTTLKTSAKSAYRDLKKGFSALLEGFCISACAAAKAVAISLMLSDVFIIVASRFELR